jgi:hypothetical protein
MAAQPQRVIIGKLYLTTQFENIECALPFLAEGIQESSSTDDADVVDDFYRPISLAQFLAILI